MQATPLSRVTSAARGLRDFFAAELQRAGYRAEARTLDVTRRDDIHDVVNSVAASYSLDYMVNNAGVGGTFAFEQATPEQWDRIIALNLRSVIDGSTAAFTIMKQQGHGNIVNVASVAGLIPIPLQVLYNTTKFAVVGFSQTLRLEAALAGVNVSVACPGNVATGIFSRPILGPSGPAVEAPSDAITAEQAAREILAGVGQNRAVIVLPDAADDLVRRYRRDPGAVELDLEYLLRVEN